MDLQLRPLLIGMDILRISRPREPCPAFAFQLDLYSRNRRFILKCECHAAGEGIEIREVLVLAIQNNRGGHGAGRAGRFAHSRSRWSERVGLDLFSLRTKILALQVSDKVESADGGGMMGRMRLVARGAG